MKFYTPEFDIVPRYEDGFDFFYDSIFCEFYDRESNTGHWLQFLIQKSKFFLKKPLVSVHYILFDKNNGVLGFKEYFSYSDAGFDKSGSVLKVGEVVFSLNGSEGRMVKGEKSVSWNLSFSKSVVSTRLLPFEFLYHKRVPTGKITSPNINLRVKGEVIINGKRVDVKEGRGVLGHNFGKNYPDFWLWSHSSFPLKGARHLVFEFLSAKSLLPIPLNFGYLEVSNIKTVFKNPFLNFSKFSKGLWKISAVNSKFVLKAEVKFKPHDLVGVWYLNSKKGRFKCLNTPYASLFLQLKKVGCGTKVAEVEAICSFEMAGMNILEPGNIRMLF